MRDIVWITLESIRYDHCSFSSYERDTTPELSRLADEGLCLSQCYSHGIWTRASSASMLTGYSPGEHRVGMTGEILPSDITTLAERFSSVGYSTSCISPTPQISEETGLARGFEVFSRLGTDTILSEPHPTDLLSYISKINTHSSGLTLDTRKHCVDYLLDLMFQRQMNSNESPMFCYLHRTDAHHPYVPPKKSREAFESELSGSLKQAIETTLRVSATLHERIANGVDITENKLKDLITLYDSLIKYTDGRTAQLVRDLQDGLSDPIIVITSDHGEMFSEHGLLAHMLEPSREVSHVPMIVLGVDEEIPEDTLIQPLDVMQMVANIAGASIDVPVGLDPRSEDREFAIVQRGEKRAREKLEFIKKFNPDFDGGKYGVTNLTTAITENGRYVLGDDRVDFYTREGNEERSTEYKQFVESWLEDHPIRTGSKEEAEFNEAMKRQLKNLGYLE